MYKIYCYIMFGKIKFAIFGVGLFYTQMRFVVDYAIGSIGLHCEVCNNSKLEKLCTVSFENQHNLEFY